jgi:hypothetical protein
MWLNNMVLEKVKRRTYRTLESEQFFYATIIWFVINAAWIALSGLFSMAFDENTHISVIRLYAQHVSPFWSQTPPGIATYGAVTRDPSYLYQYILSFPYRLLERVFHSEMSQILALRFSSIIFFAIGLVLFRKVLLQSRASRALVNTVMALLVLTPLTPFLAAQINYDNLLFPLVALALLLTIKFTRTLKDNQQIDLKTFFWLGTVCLLASLVKYAFLPIFLAIGIWLLIHLYRFYKARNRVGFIKESRRSFYAIGLLARIGLILLVIISAVLFTERYGVNVVRYHTPTPECDQVLTIGECMNNGPWRRNYLTYQDKIAHKLADPPKHTDPIHYIASPWLKLMSYQLFFSLNGEVSHFEIGEPLPVPQYMALVFGIFGVLLIIRFQKQIRKNYELTLMVLVTAIYLSVLWLQNYADFLHVGIAVAIQARYLMPVLPIIYLVFALAYSEFLNKKPKIKAPLAALVLTALVLEGGGAMTFIARSNPYWYWSNATVSRVNHKAQQVLKKFVIGS